MQTIRSTEKLASTNTHGLCDVKRTIVSNTDIRDRVTGVKTHVKLIILSRKFQEQAIEIEEEIEGEIVKKQITERKYITGHNTVEKDHENAWTFKVEEIDYFKTLLAQQLEGKSDEEQQLIIFIAQTQTAGENGKGWQGMQNWVPDTSEYVIVNEFTKVETK